MTRDSEVDEGVDRTPARPQTPTTFDFVTDARDVVEIDAIPGMEEVILELRIWDGDVHLDGLGAVVLDAREVVDLIACLEAARDRAAAG